MAFVGGSGSIWCLTCFVDLLARISRFADGLVVWKWISGVNRSMIISVATSLLCTCFGGLPMRERQKVSC